MHVYSHGINRAICLNKGLEPQKQSRRRNTVRRPKRIFNQRKGGKEIVPPALVPGLARG